MSSPVLTSKPTTRLTLPGTPQQQGSKTRGANGSSYEANKALPAWRADALTACLSYSGPKIFDPVMVDATFLYGRPQSHYGTGRNADRLKPSAPTMKATAPDLDKLQRAVGDVLTMSGIIADDRLIVTWTARKCWTTAEARTDLFLWVVPA